MDSPTRKRYGDDGGPPRRGRRRSPSPSRRSDRPPTYGRSRSPSPRNKRGSSRSPSVSPLRNKSDLYEPSKIVVWTGLSANVSEKHAREIAELWGAIVEFKFLEDLHNRMATIEYSSMGDAQKGLEQLHGMTLDHSKTKCYFTNESDPKVAEEKLKKELGPGRRDRWQQGPKRRSSSPAGHRSNYPPPRRGHSPPRRGHSPPDRSYSPPRRGNNSPPPRFRQNSPPRYQKNNNRSYGGDGDRISPGRSRSPPSRGNSPIRRGGWSPARSSQRKRSPDFRQNSFRSRENNNSQYHRASSPSPPRHGRSPSLSPRDRSPIAKRHRGYSPDRSP